MHESDVELFEHLLNASRESFLSGARHGLTERPEMVNIVCKYGHYLNSLWDDVENFVGEFDNRFCYRFMGVSRVATYYFSVTSPSRRLCSCTRHRLVGLISFSPNTLPQAHLDLYQQVCLFVCLFGFLTSSSTTRLYRGRAPGSDNFTCCHT